MAGGVRLSNNHSSNIGGGHGVSIGSGPRASSTAIRRVKLRSFRKFTKHDSVLLLASRNADLTCPKAVRQRDLERGREHICGSGIYT